MKKLSLGLAFAVVAATVPMAIQVAPAAAQSFDGGDIAAFYGARGGAPLWFAPASDGAAQQLVQLLATAQADNLNPRRYNIRGLQRALQDGRSGDRPRLSAPKPC
jgi:hypothetical protein